MTAYPDFKQKIKEQHLDNYYQLLLIHSNSIVEETIVRKHHLIAKELNLTPAKFSTILPLLVAHRSLYSNSNKDIVCNS
jgi:hypothetical protein